jgi:collagenase-like PrtC family protease
VVKLWELQIGGGVRAQHKPAGYFNAHSGTCYAYSSRCVYQHDYNKYDNVDQDYNVHYDDQYEHIDNYDNHILDHLFLDNFLNVIDNVDKHDNFFHQ